MALTLSKVDHDALRRAMVEASCDPVKAKQLAGIEGDRGLIEAQMQAAYSCQTRNLTCKPWESPPCFGDASPGHDGHIAGAKLLKRLLDAGLSRWEPDPIGALAEVEPPPAA